jgi:hypothetical protein
VFGKAFSIAGPPVGADFESMARALGIPTIGYVDAFTVTPLIGASTCSAILLEAPEPLAVGTRTGVKIGGNIPDTLANIDGTRVIVLPPTGGVPLGTLAVELTFRRDAGQTLPRLAVSGDLSPETVSFSLEVALP